MENKSKQTEILIGIDIGFGDIKAVISCMDKIISIKIPTAIARIPRISIKGLENTQDIFIYKNKKYILAEDALSSEAMIPTRNLDFLKEFTPLFIFKILCEVANKLNLNIEEILQIPTKICLGLPLDYYYDEKENIANSIKNYNVGYQRNDQQINYNIKFPFADIRAQGQGVFNDFIFDEDAFKIEFIDSNLLVVDIGFNTVDVLSIIDGKASSHGSYMLDGKGICQICKDLHLEVKNKTGIDFPEQRIKKALLEKSIKIQNQPQDLINIIKEITEEYSDYLLAEINSRSKSTINNAEKMIIAGGGVYFITEYLKKNYPSEFIHIPKDPEFSNANGYLKKLRLMAG